MKHSIPILARGADRAAADFAAAQLRRQAAELLAAADAVTSASTFYDPPIEGEMPARPDLAALVDQVSAIVVEHRSEHRLVSIVASQAVTLLTDAARLRREPWPPKATRIVLGTAAGLLYLALPALETPIPAITTSAIRDRRPATAEPAPGVDRG